MQKLFDYIHETYNIPMTIGEMDEITRIVTDSEITANHARLLSLSIELRALQKSYFRTRSRQALNASIKLESQFDSELLRQSELIKINHLPK